MKEELISLKTAKLAKKKGFNLNSPAFYGCDNPSGSTPPNKLVLRDWEKWTNFGNEDSPQEGTLIYSAPTQGLLQKWLREIHKININVEYGFYSTDEYYSFSYRLEDINKQQEEEKFISFYEEYFPSYEEALEEGLYSALQLIGISNDKN